MARQRYSIKESLNRIIRLFQGETVNEIPETLSGEVLSEHAALSDFAELLNSSLPGQSLVFPQAIVDAMLAGGIEVSNISGTYSSNPTKLTTNLYIDTGSTGTSVELPDPEIYLAYQYNIKKVLGNGNINIYPTNGGLIDGSAVLFVETQYDNVTLISDGTNWIIL